MRRTSINASDTLQAQDYLRPLLDCVPVDANAKCDLCARMSGPDRLYHGVVHLTLLWERHGRYAELAGLNRPEINRLVASAIAYHDAIYVPGRGDNEERSAELWLQSSRLSASDQERSWVADTIRATRNHLAYALAIEQVDAGSAIEKRARLWLLDLDLTPIGESPATFDSNTELLRAESKSASNERFEENRRAFLRQLDASPSIYSSPSLASAFEERARANVRRHLVEEA